MHLKSDYIENNDKADKVMEELFQSLLSRFQIKRETLLESRDFNFDCVHLMYYKCQK